MTDAVPSPEEIPAAAPPPPASDDPAPSGSARADARAEARKRRAHFEKRREGCFALFAAGNTPHEIGKAMKVSAKSVRRWIGQAIRDRRLDAPEAYTQVQVARLMKMLCALDDQLGQGNIRVVGPMTKVIEALDRYHGIEAGIGASARKPSLPSSRPSRRPPRWR